jgi:hypothetical protein
MSQVLQGTCVTHLVILLLDILGLAQLRIHLDPHLLKRQTLPQRHFGQRLVLVILDLAIRHLDIVSPKRFVCHLNLDDHRFRLVCGLLLDNRGGACRNRCRPGLTWLPFDL